MWNHRDLNDITQKEIENIIKQYIPNYNMVKEERSTDVIEKVKFLIT